MTKVYYLYVVLILILFSIDSLFAVNNPRLLIISLDGFAHHYLQKYSLPTINRLQNKGVKTKYGMQPTFTTMTYPNHMSIATGMYEEEHGIIHNRFFDKKLNKSITFGTRDEGQWSDPKVEPLWITATKQNVDAGVICWTASHNEFNGIRPLFYTSVYSDAIPIREKIDNAISYFKETSIQLVMLYHYEPDKQGHLYGPDAVEIKDILERLDKDLEYLLTRVRNELNDELNIILLSDHGMAKTKRLIQPFLQGYLNKSQVEENTLDGTLFSVTPRSGQFDEVFNNLQRIPNVTVYRRDQFPERFHYTKAVDRIGEIIVLSNDDSTLFSSALVNITLVKGAHGYDNTLASMQAIFIAYGPDFNQQIEIDSLKNVDVYHIACKILNLKPNPYASAGSLAKLTNIFRKTTNHSSKTKNNILMILFFVVTSLCNRI